MLSKKTVAKNTLIVLFSNSISRLLIFLVGIAIARFLGVEEFGFYSFVLVLGGVFFAVSDFGISFLIFREASKNIEKANELIGEGLSAKIIPSAFAFVLVFLIATFSGLPLNEFIVFVLIGFSFILGSFAAMFFSVLKAKENFSAEAITLITSHLLLLIITLIALISGQGLILVGIAFVLYSGISVLLSIYFLYKNNFEILFNGFKGKSETLRKGFIFGAIAFLVALYVAIDFALIKSILGDYLTGIYGAVAKFFFVMTVFSYAFNRALFPVLSRNSLNKERFAEIIKKSSAIMFSISLASGMVFFILKEPLILFFFGEKFLVSTELFVWLVVLIPLAFLNEITGMGLASRGIEKKLFQNLIAAVIINFTLSIFLIGIYGLHGALMATAMGLTVLLLMNLRDLYLSLKI